MPRLIRRNAERPLENNHRNGAMSNAERQRRYRDRNRGGPPKGRWAGHQSLETQAQASLPQRLSRSSVYMLRWITGHAPDVLPALFADLNDAESRRSRRRGSGIRPIYDRLRAELKEGL